MSTVWPGCKTVVMRGGISPVRQSAAAPLTLIRSIENHLTAYGDRARVRRGRPVDGRLPAEARARAVKPVRRGLPGLQPQRRLFQLRRGRRLGGGRCLLPRVVLAPLCLHAIKERGRLTHGQWAVYTSSAGLPGAECHREDFQTSISLLVVSQKILSIPEIELEACSSLLLIVANFFLLHCHSR